MIDEGPAGLVLLAAVARRHYLMHQSKVEIAEELGVSRFKVARMIEAARERGLVRIEIVRQGTLDVDTSARLQEEFGLAHAVVVDTADAVDTDPGLLVVCRPAPGVGGARAAAGHTDPGTVRQQLGRAAADLLSEIVVAGDVLGLPWSRSVHAAVGALTGLAHVDVVQLTGAIALPDFDSSAVDIVRRAARVAGGRAHVFYAPFVLDSEDSADALRRQPAVAGGLSRASEVTKALVGVGRWASGESTIHDLLSDKERRALAREGVVGELAGVFFDADGQPLRTALTPRLITLDADQLAAIPEVVAVVAGASKLEAVSAALRGGLVQGLVTDATLARALLPD